MKVFYSRSYVVPAYSFDTTRKSAWVADSLCSYPVDGVELVAPKPLNSFQVAAVHDTKYVEAVRTGDPVYLAESQGFTWDTGMFDGAVHSNGGVLAAACAALEDGIAGSLSSGLHHAKRGFGSGYCTFNGLVIAAKTLLDGGLAKSVLIVDLDAHCGGGSASLIKDDSRICQIDVSVSRYDRYSGLPNTRGRIVESATDYLAVVNNFLTSCDRRFDIVLYNAGMDPYERCDIGGLTGITRDVLDARERMVFQWCRERRIPVAFVLAGGYTGSVLSVSELVDLHRLTVTNAVQ